MSPQMGTSPAEAHATKSPIDLQEQVPRRAFELYELRGNEDEHDLDDWLQGESS
jgi:hypothetical protein